MIRSSTIKKHSKNPVPSLQKKAEKIFNEYIRLRDQKDGLFTCITCRQIKPVTQMNACHYMSAGLHNSTRFDENNVHGGCIKCNQHMHGNLIEYRRFLVEKFGEAFVQRLEIRAKMPAKIDRYTLVDIIETYTYKVKQLKAGNV